MTNPFERRRMRSIRFSSTMMASIRCGRHSPTSPAGWTAELVEADREACLAYIEEHWTDMRPKSLSEASFDAPAASTINYPGGHNEQRRR